MSTLPRLNKQRIGLFVGKWKCYSQYPDVSNYGQTPEIAYKNWADTYRAYTGKEPPRNEHRR